jgi:hypothetical protein
MRTRASTSCIKESAVELFIKHQYIQMVKFPGRYIGSMIFGVLAVALAIHLYKYNADKSSVGESLSDGHTDSNGHQDTGAQKASECCTRTGADFQAANPLGQNSTFASVSGASGAAGLAPTGAQGYIANPADLLPKNVNSEKWAQMNPSGTGSLDGVNLLNAGSLIGVDTVSTSLRNANLQVRSEPPNPQVSVGPWNNTTITPELSRRPLEIGCGPL